MGLRRANYLLADSQVLEEWTFKPGAVFEIIIMANRIQHIAANAAVITSQRPHC